MAEYIDREPIIKRLRKMSINPQTTFINSVLEGLLISAPKADVVEVVRCKECIHKVVTEDGEYNPEDIVCDYHMSDGFCENDFCSYGEKMDGKDGAK